MSEQQLKAVKRRRSGPTQEEKSAETRRKLIAAAVSCLHARGYSAVTVEQILQEAGVSRGSMLHQFPTRIDLMLGVVQSVFEDENGRYYEWLSKVDDRLERILRLPELLWETNSRPEGIAVLEILLASRSDAVLSSALVPLQAELDRIQRGWAREMLVEAGLRVDDEGPPLRRMLLAAARGLAIDMIFTDNPAEVAETARFLRTIMERHYAADIAALRKGKSRGALG
jgi:AcrR family transcriptional regulator